LSDVRRPRTAMACSRRTRRESDAAAAARGDCCAAEGPIKAQSEWRTSLAVSGSESKTKRTETKQHSEQGNTGIRCYAAHHRASSEGGWRGPMGRRILLLDPPAFADWSASPKSHADPQHCESQRLEAVAAAAMSGSTATEHGTRKSHEGLHRRTNRPRLQHIASLPLWA
jgi:hypothetical protein